MLFGTMHESDRLAQSKESVGWKLIVLPRHCFDIMLKLSLATTKEECGFLKVLNDAITSELWLHSGGVSSTENNLFVHEQLNEQKTNMHQTSEKVNM